MRRLEGVEVAVGSATVPVVVVFAVVDTDADAVVVDAVVVLAVTVVGAGGMGEATPNTLPCNRDVNEDLACPIGLPN